MVETRKHLISLDELDHSFSKKIIDACGTNLYACFQCGTCTASCPVFRFNENYNPRLIIRSAILGLVGETLDNNFLWFCVSCNSCTQRCPRGVRPSEVMRTIRNMAIKEGNINGFYKRQALAIVNWGRIWKDEEIVNELREDLELPPLSSVDRQELSKILEGTDIKTLLSAKKGDGDQ